MNKFFTIIAAMLVLALVPQTSVAQRYQSPTTFNPGLTSFVDENSAQEFVDEMVEQFGEDAISIGVGHNPQPFRKVTNAQRDTTRKYASPMSRQFLTAEDVDAALADTFKVTGAEALEMNRVLNDDLRERRQRRVVELLHTAGATNPKVFEGTSRSLHFFLQISPTMEDLAELRGEIRRLRVEIYDSLKTHRGDINNNYNIALNALSEANRANDRLDARDKRCVEAYLYAKERGYVFTLWVECADALASIRIYMPEGPEKQFTGEKPIKWHARAFAGTSFTATQTAALAGLEAEVRTPGSISILVQGLAAFDLDDTNYSAVFAPGFMIGNTGISVNVGVKGQFEQKVIADLHASVAYSFDIGEKWGATARLAYTQFSYTTPSSFSQANPEQISANEFSGDWVFQPEITSTQRVVMATIAIGL